MYQIIIYTPIIIFSSLLTKIKFNYNPENDLNSVALVSRTLFLFSLFASLWCLYIWFNPKKDKIDLLNKFFNFSFFIFIGFSIGLTQLTHRNNIVFGGLIHGDMGRIISWSINYRDEKLISFYSPLVTSSIGFIDKMSDHNIFETTKIIYVVMSISLAFGMYFLTNKFLFEKMGSLFLILLLPTFFIEFKIGALIAILIVIHITVLDVIKDILSKRQRVILGLFFGFILLIDYSYIYWFFLWVIAISVSLFFNKQREEILDRLSNLFLFPSLAFINILILFNFKRFPLSQLIGISIILFLLSITFLYVKSQKLKIYVKVIKTLHILIIPLLTYTMLEVKINDSYRSADVNDNLLPDIFLNKNNIYYIIISLFAIIFIYLNGNLKIDAVTLLLASQILAIILMFTYVASNININGNINMYPRGIYLIGLLTNYIIILILLKYINFLNIDKINNKDSEINLQKILVIMIFISVLLMGKFNSAVQNYIFKNYWNKDNSTSACAELPEIDFEYAYTNFKLYAEAMEACYKINFSKTSTLKFSTDFDQQENDNKGEFVWAVNSKSAKVITHEFQKSLTLVNPPCTQLQTVKIYLNEKDTKILNLKNQRQEILNLPENINRIRFETDFEGCKVPNDSRQLTYKLYYRN